MSTIHFRYKRSEELCKRLLVETGEYPKSQVDVALDLGAEPAELRAELVEALGLPRWLSYPEAQGYELAKPVRVLVNWQALALVETERLVLDEDLTSLAQLRPLFEAWRVANAEREALEPEAAAERERRAVERAKREREEKEEKERRYAAEAAWEAAQRVEAARRDEEKRAWVAAHGSEYLRRACGAGYDCQRQYVTERAALEHPGAVIDWKNQAEWRSRSCPSTLSLDLAERVGGEVVWLTEPAFEDEINVELGYEEPFRPHEAVVVEGYLGKYRLVYEVG